MACSPLCTYHKVSFLRQKDEVVWQKSAKYSNGLMERCNVCTMRRICT